MSKMIDGVYVIEPEKPILCELCGEIKETRQLESITQIYVSNVLTNLSTLKKQQKS